jgi:hypothetical protein
MIFKNVNKDLNKTKAADTIISVEFSDEEKGLLAFSLVDPSP